MDKPVPVVVTARNGNEQGSLGYCQLAAVKEQAGHNLLFRPGVQDAAAGNFSQDMNGMGRQSR